MHSHEQTILNTIINREHIALNRGKAMYIVKRVYGNHTDYLKSWDSEYGTSCTGNKNTAKRFTHISSANKAAHRANKTCCGYRDAKKPNNMIFSSMQLNV